MSDQQFLVVIETQRVKAYLFGSPILRETRGASLMLDRLNRSQTKEIPRGTSGEEVYLEGRLRYFAERLLQTGSLPHSYMLRAQIQPLCKGVENTCAVCRLFGNPSIPALLRIGQASPLPPWDNIFRQLLTANSNPVVHPDVEILPGTALSRLRCTALPDHLFFDEAVPAISFLGKLLLDSRVPLQETR